MDPSDHDERDLGNAASDGGHGPTQANGGPAGGEGWLRSVMENSNEVVKVLDLDGTLRYASPAFGRVFGYDPEEVVGKMNVLDHVHPDDLPHVLEETERVLSGGASPPTWPSTASATPTARGGGWRASAPTFPTTRRSVAWW